MNISSVLHWPWPRSIVPGSPVSPVLPVSTVPLVVLLIRRGDRGQVWSLINVLWGKDLLGLVRGHYMAIPRGHLMSHLVMKRIMLHMHLRGHASHLKKTASMKVVLKVFKNVLMNLKFKGAHTCPICWSNSACCCCSIFCLFSSSLFWIVWESCWICCIMCVSFNMLGCDCLKNEYLNHNKSTLMDIWIFFMYKSIQAKILSSFLFQEHTHVGLHPHHHFLHSQNLVASKNEKHFNKYNIFIYFSSSSKCMNIF